MGTHASRDTTTGAAFEEKVTMENEVLANYSPVINLSKHKLYKYLEEKGIDWTTLLSRKILPDEAYLRGDMSFDVYEKKYQETEGSADEKPQTCGFKIREFRKIGNALGVPYTSYTYILSDWFKQDKYRDMLEYIHSVNGCSYIFESELEREQT